MEGAMPIPDIHQILEESRPYICFYALTASSLERGY